MMVATLSHSALREEAAAGRGGGGRRVAGRALGGTGYRQTGGIERSAVLSGRR